MRFKLVKNENGEDRCQFNLSWVEVKLIRDAMEVLRLRIPKRIFELQPTRTRANQIVKELSKALGEHKPNLPKELKMLFNWRINK